MIFNHVETNTRAVVYLVHSSQQFRTGRADHQEPTADQRENDCERLIQDESLCLTQECLDENSVLKIWTEKNNLVEYNTIIVIG